MKTKNKVLLSVGVLCLVAVVAVVAVVAIWAATRQTVTSEVNVTYKATNIVGSASANVIAYDVEGQKFEATAMTGTVTFNREDEDDKTQTLTPAKAIELADKDKQDYVIFEYVFENGSESVPYTATLTYTDSSNDDKNYELYFKDFAEAKTVEETDWMKVVGAAENKKTQLTPSIGVCTVPVKAGGQNGKQYVYVLVKIVNQNDDMTFTGSFSWALAENRD